MIKPGIKQCSSLPLVGDVQGGHAQAALIRNATFAA
jgi:hypothetical protein